LTRCKNCFHSISQKGELNPNCRECSICIRSPEYASKRNFNKKIEIEGVTFEAPMDMYISRDRMRYEDYMRMKKITEALARREYEDVLKLKKPIRWAPDSPIIPGITRPNWEYYQRAVEQEWLDNKGGRTSYGKSKKRK